MTVIGIDIGGTKISGALYHDKEIHTGEKLFLGDACGDEVTGLIVSLINMLLQKSGGKALAVGIAIPGIWNEETGTAWAPNIPGWIDYPLRHKLQNHFCNLPIYITNDRACYILGEVWKGNAKGCRDAVFLAAGTGIAAGIVAGGTVLNGAAGAAGAIGWMALSKPYNEKYSAVGCNEYYASGPGLVRYAREILTSDSNYSGIFKNEATLDAEKLIIEFENGDEVAVAVINNAISYWGMCVANLVSIFNPEKIILGGGVFNNNGCRFREAIYNEAMKWAQPVSMRQVSIECSALGEKAGIYGALYYALEQEKQHVSHE